MALHPDFPSPPYALLPPEQRGFPAAEELRDTTCKKLLPPLVTKVREAVAVQASFERLAPKGWAAPAANVTEYHA